MSPIKTHLTWRCILHACDWIGHTRLTVAGSFWKAQTHEPRTGEHAWVDLCFEAMMVFARLYSVFDRDVSHERARFPPLVVVSSFWLRTPALPHVDLCQVVQDKRAVGEDRGCVKVCFLCGKRWAEKQNANLICMSSCCRRGCPSCHGAFVCANVTR